MRREWFELFYKQGWQQTMIAEKYNYPVWTVNRVLNKLSADEGRKTRSDKGKSKPSPTLELPDFEKLALEGESTEVQIEMFINALFSAVRNTKKLKASQAILYVNQLTNALRRLRSIQFANMAKNLDLKIVHSIIRRYEPDATEMRVIEIFKEEAARVKAEKVKA